MSKKYWPHLVIASSVAVFMIGAMGAGIFHLQREKVIDLLFTSRESTADIVIVTIDDESIQRVGQWPWPRAVFGTLAKNLNGAKVIGIDVNFKESSRAGTADDLAFVSGMKNIRTPVVLNAEINDRGQRELPIEVLAAVSQQGFPNLTLDGDGVARYARVLKDGFPSLAYKVAQIYKSETLSAPAEYFRIAYQAPDQSLPRVYAADVISGSIPKVFFENKIVLVGATSSDLQDFHLTPFGRMSGVEIQANITQALIDGRFFKEHENTNRILVLLLCFAVAWLCVSLKKIAYLIASLASTAVIYIVVAFISFERYYVIDILYPLLAIVITATVSLIVQYVSTTKEKKFIQDTFSRYLAPQVVNKLIADSSQLKLGGEKREISVLFSDIRGFTALSETMEPQELSKFLNQYLTRMTNIVLERDGVIDKYIGDAIMSFWGAPLENQQHAADAVLTALDMIASLHDFNLENSLTGRPPINIGIGINSGDATVGNMGSEKRFDYTAIGDTVNLASRLEGLNKLYESNIIVSEATRDFAAKDRPEIMFREIDRVCVKGKRESVRIFEVVPYHRKIATAEFLPNFKEALAAYYAGDWQIALDGFDAILDKREDGPSRVLQKRCHEMSAQDGNNAPWEGIWELIEK